MVAPSVSRRRWPCLARAAGRTGLMELLLSGATGFLGTYVLRAFSGGHAVHALARTPLSASGVDWIECDLTNRLPRERLPRHVDAIVHLAQSRRDRDF